MMFGNEALERAIAAVNGSLGYPGRILTGGQRGAAQGALMAARDIGLSTGGVAPKGWRVTLPGTGLDGCDSMLAEFGLIEHDSDDFREIAMHNVVGGDGTLWIGEIGEKSEPSTIAIADELGVRLICNPRATDLRNWCECHQICVLNVAGECGWHGSPGIFTQAYDLIGEAFGGGHEWCIRNKYHWRYLPYAGRDCTIAGVPPGEIYSNKDDAIADCLRLRKTGIGFKVGKIYLPQEVRQCSAPQ
jgi:hypothetical protein